ncbi:recombinase RecA [Pseudoleptotrichia goodfellowii]|uniref:Protein RecA n=2 Tax=Pseudoleptotrichia goodfellowii TaxID=157692 RepID=D0GLV8_9FUSO|nr:recombinase RecA [Pseudoleptotrichia goodfellowii]EEY34871.1 RecA protein [Pseudoleptotrichia goodfellowii F0264]BBM35964.1 recombinase A [Pseudoleptotrichia goodfellowii]
MARKKAVEEKDDNKVQSEKERVLNLALTQIQKEFGEGSIMKLGENQKMNVKSISTGSINLDMALGIGGVPRGRIIEIYGAESSGKTTLALHVIAEAQKEGGVAAFIDAEHALDPVYAKALGVNIDELLISQPDTGEQALEIADMLVRSGAMDVIVVDSVAALVPKAEIEGEMGDQQMGLQARLMSKALRKLTANISKSSTVMIFINQIREKIGGFSFTPGPQTTTSGGRALKFFSTVRMEVKRVGSVKQGEEVIGNEVLVKVTKNKVAPPFKEARFNVMYGMGISRIGEILDAALELGVASKSGAWFSYGDERLGQGRVNVEKMLQENKELYERMEKDVLDAIRPKTEEEKEPEVVETAKPKKETAKKSAAKAEKEEVEIEE